MSRTELESGELVIDTWSCGVPSSPESAVAAKEGTLVLTNRRLLFEPMRLPVLGARWLLGGEGLSFPLDQIELADAVPGRVPRLRVVLNSGESQVFLVSGARWSVPWSEKKWLALEQIVEALNAR